MTTESVSAGESKDIYDGGESSIQTMTFNMMVLLLFHIAKIR